jgi:hypothetical protein
MKVNVLDDHFIDWNVKEFLVYTNETQTFMKETVYFVGLYCEIILDNARN